MIFDELTFANNRGSCVDSSFIPVAECDRKMRSKHRVSEMYSKVRFTRSWITQDYNVVKLSGFIPFVFEF